MYKTERSNGGRKVKGEREGGGKKKERGEGARVRGNEGSKE